MSLEDIKKEYKDIFNNIDKGKEKYINLFKNNTREIFECLFKKDEEQLKEYVQKKLIKLKITLKNFVGTIY